MMWRFVAVWMMSPASPSPPAWLVLEDGSRYTGTGIGVAGTTFGELVFNTSASGYQEILTDPSYRGQIVLMTYPEIGNYGVNPDDYESERIHVQGFVVRRLSPVTSSWRATLSLQEFLYRHAIVGIEGIDTRSITRRIRDKGSMKAGITTDFSQMDSFLADIRSQPSLADQDLVEQVTTLKPYILVGHSVSHPETAFKRLVVVDFGIKKSILHYLQQTAHEIMVLPASSSFESIMAHHPQGVLLSNGPGDPSVLEGAISMARQLIAACIPTFGICLGHQILALACGADVCKMRFGHHGGNHPVRDQETGRITITSQNHGYAVVESSMPDDTMKVTHINLNDGSVEGFRHQHAPVWSVQFHPEASPGPHDSQYLFTRFVQDVITHQQKQVCNLPRL
jgi:carbamoyl-phosphate synthase small subunit